MSRLAIRSFEHGVQIAVGRVDGAEGSAAAYAGMSPRLLRS